MKKPDPHHPIDKRVAHRLSRLESLIDSEYGGSASVFESRTGIKMTQVSQWFTGYRALRDKALARLEYQCGKPEGWFDEGGESFWPFSNELRQALVKLPAEAFARIENIIRATLGMAPLQTELSVTEQLKGPSPTAAAGADTTVARSSVGDGLTVVKRAKKWTGPSVFDQPTKTQGGKHGRSGTDRGDPRK